VELGIISYEEFMNFKRVESLLERLVGRFVDAKDFKTALDVLVRVDRRYSKNNLPDFSKLTGYDYNGLDWIAEKNLEYLAQKKLPLTIENLNRWVATFRCLGWNWVVSADVYEVAMVDGDPEDEFRLHFHPLGWEGTNAYWIYKQGRLIRDLAMWLSEFGASERFAALRQLVTTGDGYLMKLDVDYVHTPETLADVISVAGLSERGWKKTISDVPSPNELACFRLGMSGPVLAI
jgi:hypothetical protein